MAGDWIKVEYTTPQKPEMYAVASRLHRDIDVTFARWFRIWRWADENLGTDGLAVSMTLEQLSDIGGIPGIAEAFAAEGWLIQTDKGVVFKDFGKHNGKPAKERLLASERQRRARSVTKMSRSDRDDFVTPSSLLSSSGSLSSPEGGAGETNGPSFMAFWLAYPQAKRTRQGDCIAMWSGLIQEGIDPEAIVAGAKEYAASHAGQSVYCLSALKWLDGRCWLDDRAAWAEHSDKKNGKPKRDYARIVKEAGQ